MAPITRNTKHKFENTKVGEQVLDLVIPYIHDAEDRNSLSLVSRNFYELDGITRKRLTVHVVYYPNPASLSKRFPFTKSITIQGPPSGFNQTYRHHRIKITPWIQQLANEFRCLKELNIHCMVVHDEDLETLATTRGKDLRSLKLRRCKGFSTDGLMHVSKYCNQLRTLSMDFSYIMEVKDGFWLHQLALNSTVLEMLKIKNMGLCNAEDVTLLSKNCCNSLISLQIGKCYLSKLGDVFRYAVRLEHFGGYSYDKEESELVGFKFPPNIRSLSGLLFRGRTQYSSILPRLNQIRILKLAFAHMDEDNQCLLFKRCPNLEVLYTDGQCGDRILEVLGKFCKKLRKLTHYGLVTQVGLIALANGCIKIECLKVRLGDISNEAIKCLGTHLKNLCEFRMRLVQNDEATDLPLDNGIRVMLKGCRKLERLDLHFHWHKGLTDLGLEYIGEYGANLRSLFLTLSGNSNAGLVKLSKGCPSLGKLKLWGYPFSEQAIVSSMFNIPSLRYVWGFRSGYSKFAFTRSEVQL